MKKKILICALFVLFALLFLSCKSTSHDPRATRDPASLVLSPKSSTDDQNIDRSSGEEAGKKSPVITDEETLVQPQIAKKDDTVIPKHLDAENYYNIGISLYKTGHYEDAVGAFNKTLEINPDDTRAYYDLAMAHIMLNNNTAAFGDYKKLQGLNQDMADNLRKAAVQAVSANSSYKLVVQAGAFRVLKNAKRLLNDLKADYLFVSIENPGSLHKVLIHGVKTMEEGILIMQDIKKKHNIVPFMIIRD